MKHLRLGAPVENETESPHAWVQAHRDRGYRAAYCPLPLDATDERVRAFKEAAADSDIVISEVGAWSNPLSPDGDESKAALEKCRAALDLAERIGARCAVNLAGSGSSRWLGPHPGDLTDSMFERVVESIQSVIDAVKPVSTRYAIEPMPWMFPDSPDSYLDLLKAVDRQAFGVHIDIANWLNSPRRHFFSADFTRECFRKLGPHVRSIHIKDSVLGDGMTTHIDEVRPGLGTYDFSILFEEVHTLNPDLPLMLEHLTNQEEYAAAAETVRMVGARHGFAL